MNKIESRDGEWEENFNTSITVEKSISLNNCMHKYRSCGYNFNLLFPFFHDFSLKNLFSIAQTLPHLNLTPVTAVSCTYIKISFCVFIVMIQ